MSLGLNKTKRRISSVKSTQKITKAMEMVATVKLKRFRKSYDDGLLYTEKLEATLAELLHRQKEGSESIYSKPNGSKGGTLYIAVTSNLGLCAGYNANLFKFLEANFDKGSDELIPLGTKGAGHYAHLGDYKISDLAEKFDLAMAGRDLIQAADALLQAYREGKYKTVKIVYTHYVNSLNFTPSESKLLPVELEFEATPQTESCPSLIEPELSEFIEGMLPQYLAGELYSKLVESQLCEQGSRRNAMENANDNADELLNQLTIEYNKARQTAITQEIVEVVSGSAGQTK
ncbi:MAG: ATP synthase F1 subunit gamma [Bacilli bacterium]|nr:ATP synthase F1 subunit gamma [Bacilli bacterium]